MPDTISHYRILHPLGSGGMGEVYAGLDETLKRRVALKAIRAEQRLSAVSKARFLREARILSQLDHPHVCRVYDYIEGDESDWLVLELIEGKSLQAALAGGLDPGSRIVIARQIADVLVATHTAGVVHRDLKPANVMLTRGDAVKVLDFGIAQSNDAGDPRPDRPPPAVSGDAGTAIHAADPAVTSTFPSAGDVTGRLSFHIHTDGGVIVGTPAYMSPEQARGEPATAASDMYSFGLLLQELYTGHPPYPRGIGSAELIDRARRADTLPPEGAPADVAALIDRLKQPAPAQRPTAVETAARLRWIADRPKRLTRRLVVAAVALAAVLGAMKYTIDLARQRTIAVAARDEADRRRGQAEDLIGFMLGDLRTRLEPVGRLEILDQVGDKAMDYFAAVPASELSDEELLRRSAALYQIGDVRIARGNLEEATPPLEESLALAKTLVDRRPDDGDRLFGLAQSHFWVGYVHWKRHDLDAARRHFESYLELAHRLVALDPAREEWQREVAYANSNLGSVLEARGDLAGALEGYRACLRIEQSLLERAPADKDLRHSVAASHNLIGVVLRSTGRLDEAANELRAELKIRSQLFAAEPRNATFHLRLGIAHAHVGHVLAAQGRTDDAVAEYQRAVSAYEDLVGRDAVNSNWQRELATGRYYLALAHLAQRRHAGALPLLRQSVAITQRLADRDATNAAWQRDLAEQRRALGEALLAAGDAAAAVREAEIALATSAALLKENPGDIHASRIASTAHALLARAWSRRGDPDRARRQWTLAHAAIARVAEGSSDYRVLDPLAVALVRLGRPDDAAVVIQKLDAMGYRDPSFLRAIGRRGSDPPSRVRVSGG